MPALKDSIARLAEQFASQVLSAIRSASLDDIAVLAGGRARAAAAVAAAPAAPSGRARGGRGGRRRRTKDDIAALGARIVELLQSSPAGLRAEQIRTQLGVARKELPRVLSEIVSSGQARKEGQKRATTYFSGGGGGGARKSGAKKRGKRGGRAKKRG